MRSDLAAPIGVLATVVITVLILGVLVFFGIRPLNEASRGFGEWTAEDGDAKLGEAIFAANCAACHQSNGSGRPGLAPSIRNRDFLAIASDEFIRTTITRGRAETAMIPRPDLSDHDIACIIAYLRDVPVPNPLDIELDPDRVIEGDAVEGSHLYATYCASCHGPGGEGYAYGGSGPGIALAGFLDVASDDYIFQTIKKGRVSTPMMSFSGPGAIADLSDQEIGDIIAFLKAQPGQRIWAVANTTTSPPDPAKGRSLFAVNCAACHQKNGEGKAGLAPSIRNRDFLAIASDDFIRKTVAGGRPGTAMVPRPDLAGDHVTHIIAYLRALPVAHPFSVDLDPEWIAKGDPNAGKVKFGAYCASCHGPAGEGYSAGGSGPGIGLAGFLNVASDDYIFQTVKHGRIGTAMMPFYGARGLANLEESDIEDIIVYLRTKTLTTELRQ